MDNFVILREIFPSVDDHLLISAMDECGSNIENTIDRLFSRLNNGIQSTDTNIINNLTTDPIDILSDESSGETLAAKPEESQHVLSNLTHKKVEKHVAPINQQVATVNSKIQSSFGRSSISNTELKCISPLPQDQTIISSGSILASLGVRTVASESVESKIQKEMKLNQDIMKAEQELRNLRMKDLKMKKIPVEGSENRKKLALDIAENRKNIQELKDKIESFELEKHSLRNEGLSNYNSSNNNQFSSGTATTVTTNKVNLYLNKEAESAPTLPVSVSIHNFPNQINGIFSDDSSILSSWVRKKKRVEIVEENQEEGEVSILSSKEHVSRCNNKSIKDSGSYVYEEENAFGVCVTEIENQEEMRKINQHVQFSKTGEGAMCKPFLGDAVTNIIQMIDESGEQPVSLRKSKRRRIIAKEEEPLYSPIHTNESAHQDFVETNNIPPQDWRFDNSGSSSSSEEEEDDFLSKKGPVSLSNVLDDTDEKQYIFRIQNIQAKREQLRPFERRQWDEKETTRLKSLNDSEIESPQSIDPPKKEQPKEQVATTILKYERTESSNTIPLVQNSYGDPSTEILKTNPTHFVKRNVNSFHVKKDVKNEVSFSQSTLNANRVLFRDAWDDELIEIDCLTPPPTLPCMQRTLRASTSISCPRWLFERLFPHQKEALRWLSGLHALACSGGILADEMGLGKTISVSVFLATLWASKDLDFLSVNLAASQSRLSSAALLRLEESCPKEWNDMKKLIEVRNSGGCLLVAPVTTLSQWVAELHKWTPQLRVCLLHGKSDSNRHNLMRSSWRLTLDAGYRSDGIIVTSYETMRRFASRLSCLPFVCMILDEGHKIRNPSSAVTQIAKLIPAGRRIILSGSPVQNSLKELWSLIDFVSPGFLGDLKTFETSVSAPIREGGFSHSSPQQIEVASRTAMALHSRTSPLILRRTKSAIGRDALGLGAKKEEIVVCHMSPAQYVLYCQLLHDHAGIIASLGGDDFRKKSKQNAIQEGILAGSQTKWKFGGRRGTGEQRAKAFALIIVLRKVCNHPDLIFCGGKNLSANQISGYGLGEDFGNPGRSGKLVICVELLKLWRSQGRKSLIFSQSVPMVRILWKLLEQDLDWKVLMMDGSVSLSKRQSIVDAFSRGEADVLILTTRVGGLGLNLTTATRVIIFDPDWNPMTDAQAKERAWRIGQSEDVEIYRLITSGTVEERIYHRQVHKQLLAQKVLDDPSLHKGVRHQDLYDLFATPPPPPGFDPLLAVRTLGNKYRQIFKHAVLSASEDAERETAMLEKTLSKSIERGELTSTDQGISQAETAALNSLFSDASLVRGTIGENAQGGGANLIQTRESIVAARRAAAAMDKLGGGWNALRMERELEALLRLSGDLGISTDEILIRFGNSVLEGFEDEFKRILRSVGRLVDRELRGRVWILRTN